MALCKHNKGLININDFHSEHFTFCSLASSVLRLMDGEKGYFRIKATFQPSKQTNKRFIPAQSVRGNGYIFIKK